MHAYVWFAGGESRTIEFLNKCSYTVWPATQPNSQKPQLSTTGFELKTNERRQVDAPFQWGGRMWARTGCSQQAGGFRCETADCGSGAVECNGNGGQTPATLAEFTLDGDGGRDFYDTSLVDGFNIPLGITPQGGTGDKCTVTDCPADVNADCPSDLVVTAADGKRIGCKSACVQFGKPEYCCTPPFDNADACKPSRYSMFFKNKCPRAYSYAFDDLKSTFVCTGGNYLITFCP
ncbi:hypothetical protein ACLOJK_026013 [Asimina triloba]